LTDVNQKVKIMIQKEILLINLDFEGKTAEILKQKVVLVNGGFGHAKRGQNS